MKVLDAPGRKIRFGTFDVDLAAGELCKHGRRVKLQDLPFRLLVSLLEQPGEVVSHEKLREVLWGGTVVDFEDGLHTAIRKLRYALGDSASNPRFVETVPRRGYRFIAPVTLPEDSSKAPTPQSPRRITFLAAGTVVALVSLAGTLVWLHSVNGPAVNQSLQAIPLTSYPGIERAPDFSPDGRQVAFTWNGERGDNFDIYVQAIDGSARLRLTRDPGRDHDPAWSPDGSRIAFTREGGVYLIAPIGGAETRLTSVAGAGVSWSPDGRYLAVSDRSSESEPLGIFLVSVATGEKRRLTMPAGLGAADERPAYSPNGKHIAFMRRATTICDVYIVPVEGGAARQVTRVGESMLDVAWTPDSRGLVFDVWKGGLYRIAAFGGAPRKAAHIDAAGDNARQPAISRPSESGGTQLAYTVEIPNWNILAMPLSEPGSGRAEPVTVAGSTRADLAPSISPDGRRIAFSSQRTGTAEIWVSNMDGSNPLRVTFFEEGLGATSPNWSPDGRWIVFDATLASNRDIYLVRAKGGPVKQLTTEGSIECQPSWSNDGHWIYFMSDRSGTHQIWKIPAGGGAAIQVTRNGGYQAFESPDGQRLFYAKQDGGRGVWSAPVNGGPETLLVEGAWHNYWDVAEDGIYYMDLGERRPREESEELPFPIKRFDFRTGQTATVASIVCRVRLGPPSFSVGPDGRWIAWAASDTRNADLMLIRDFR